MWSSCGVRVGNLRELLFVRKARSSQNTHKKRGGKRQLEKDCKMEGIRDLGMGLWNETVGWGKCPDGGVGGYRKGKRRQDMVEGIW